MNSGPFRPLPFVVALSLAGIVCGSTPRSTEAQQDGNPLSAREVLEATVSTYHNLSSYQDRGRDSLGDLRFETVFERPDRFLLEMYVPREGAEGHVTPSFVRVVGADVTVPAQEGDSSNRPARAWQQFRAGAADIVLRLLSAELHNTLSEADLWTLTDLEAVSHLGFSPCARKECHRIRGTTPDGTELILWIEVDRFVVRRIESPLGHEVSMTARLDPPLPTEAFDVPPWAAPPRPLSVDPPADRSLPQAEAIDYLGLWILAVVSWQWYWLYALLGVAAGHFCGTRWKIPGPAMVGGVIGVWFLSTVLPIGVTLLTSENLDGDLGGLGILIPIMLAPGVTAFAWVTWFLGYRLSRRPRP